MVSIIKNQLLKHLSRYTKNLSSDKINLSTFRGEGELSNLQLDENVLTELLELPSWLRLKSAWCNHVSFRISWTKLKSVPITLTLDEVNITVETCEINSKHSNSTSNASLQNNLQPTVPQGKYSFIHKIVDGITIIVNTVNVKFLSPAFTASVQMSRIRVESKSPKWLSADLRVTRLKDPQKGILLIFKELSWQTVRIEASSTQDTTLTPLRLLTNQARCRITIRKRLSDCSILASRLVLILDDLLWVLTDSQLKAALHFVDSLTDLIKLSTRATQKTKAQRKLETLPEYQAQMAQSNRHTEPLNLSTSQKLFNAFDVRETSYHFFSQRIDLHLCDDEGDGRSAYPELKDGGALQISIQAFQTDYYPYHLTKSGRSHWAKYKEAAIPPAMWLEQSLNTFRESVLNLCQPNRPSAHAPLERTSVPPSPTTSIPPCTPVSGSGGQSFGSGQSTPSHQPHSQKTINRNVLQNLSKLMCACVILRIDDFTLYRVTTSGKKQMPKEFIAGDKDRYSFPPEMPILHAEFTYFYYPGDFVFPLPPSKVFCYVNPVQINFDLSTLLWFNSFAINLHESLLRTSVMTSALNQNKESPVSPSSIASNTSDTLEPNLMYMDVKLEAIMPRIIIESTTDVSNQRDRPKVMQIQIARFALTNIREMGSSRADLAQALHSLQEGSLVFGSDFPSVNGDLCIVTDRILSHVAASDVQTSFNNPFDDGSNSNSFISASNDLMNFSRYTMWSEPRDVWCIKLDPVWIDFMGARSLASHKTIPFVDAVPITLWLYGGNMENVDKTVIADYHAPLRRESAQSVIARDQLDLENSNIKKTTQSTSPSNNLIDTNDSRVADIHCIAHVSNLVSLQIDHYQFLFLLRLAEEMTELTTFLTVDTERILEKQNTKKSLIFGCVVPQVEVTLIMPSVTPGKESSGCDAESVILPDSASLGDDLHLNSTNTTWHQSLDHLKNTNPFNSIETPSPTTNEPAYDNNNGNHTSNPNPRGYNVQIQSTPTHASSSNSQASSRPDTGIFSQSMQSSTGGTVTSGKPGNKSRNSITDTNISKELNMGFMSMKKGFSNFMTSIDSAIKSTNVINDDASDTFSIYSDVSSDSESFVNVIGDDKTTDCIDVMFKLNPFSTDSNLKVSPVEVASEVYEEPANYKTNMSSPSEPSEGSCWRRRDLVSMATFRLTTLEIIKQNEGYKSSLKLQVSAISCDECGAIPWDELQTKFGARCRAWNLAPYNPEAPPTFQLRLEETLTPPDKTVKVTNKKMITSWFKHHADIRLKDLTMDLNMSTVIGLGDLIEDEVISNPLPLNINLSNVKLNLIEDRPPVNITSPGAIPINLAIGKMFIKRDSSGVLHIQPDTMKNMNLQNELGHSSINKGRDKEVLSLQLVMQQIKIENDNLRKQLNNTKENTENLRMKNRQENDTLRTYLKAAQDDISILLEEKKALIDTVKSLQQQLTLSTDIHKKSSGPR